MSDSTHQPPAADDPTLVPLPDSTSESRRVTCVSNTPLLTGDDDGVTPREAANDTVTTPAGSEIEHSQVITPSETDQWPLTNNTLSDMDYRPNIWYHDEDEASLEGIPSSESEFDEITTATFKILDKFTVFPNFPLELRRQIWKAAIDPRLVHWRPGGGKPPAIMHTSRESRGETFMAYTRVEFPYHRRDTYSVFINFDVDILYRKQELPWPVRDPNTRQLITPVWSQTLKRLAINLDQATRDLKLRPSRPGLPFRSPRLWTYLKACFPHFEELIVILYPNLERGNKLEKLVEVSNQDVENETIKELVQQTQPGAMKAIRQSLLDREQLGFGGPLKLKFMRVPVERRRKLCEGCHHVMGHSAHYVHVQGGLLRIQSMDRTCANCVKRKFTLWYKERDLGRYWNPWVAFCNAEGLELSPW